MGTLTFGWQTAILIVPMAVMLLTAAALASRLRNRLANRLLAVLLVVIAGILTPWAIGFASFYDRWPWLSFAPFSIPLTVAPLLYAYLYALVTGRLPNRFWWHMTPGIIQFAFQAASFVLPLSIKLQWAAASGPIYDIVAAIGIAAGFLGYGFASRKLLQEYRSWLATLRSDDNRFAATWVANTITAGVAMLALWAVFEVANAVTPLNYMGYMGLYVGIGLFGTYLAMECWRHAQLPFPHFRNDDDESNSAEYTDEKDWSALGAQWKRRLREELLFRDPELSLPTLARHFGTNQTYLSRAFNEGLDINFSTLVNRLRCEDVAKALEEQDQRDILTLALDAGFNSKASFNRRFRDYFDMTPSAYRKATSQKQ